MPNKLHFKLATPEEIRRTLCDRLKALRLRQNLGQAELAAAAGVSRGTVQNLESSAQCSLDSLVRICAALGAVDDLEPLFNREPLSVAELERASEPLRKRARARAKHEP